MYNAAIDRQEFGCRLTTLKAQAIVLISLTFTSWGITWRLWKENVVLIVTGHYNSKILSFRTDAVIYFELT